MKKLKLLLLSGALTLISLVNMNSVKTDASIFDKVTNKANRALYVEENNNMSVLDELWYKNTPMYKEFAKGKVYEENFKLEQYYKVSYEDSAINRLKTGSDYVIEQVSKEDVKKAMEQINSKELDVKDNGYIQLVIDVNKWNGDNYDVSSSYYVLTSSLVVGNGGSSHYIGTDCLTSSFSGEFSFDPKSVVGFTQAEDIYTNETVSSNPNILTDLHVVGMEAPLEKQLLHKNHRGMISYTVKRSYGSYGNIYTNYFDNIKSFNGSISISGDGLGSVGISPETKFKRIYGSDGRAPALLINF